MSTATERKKKKKQSGNGAVKGKTNLRSMRAKRDDDIMNTNDSSIVSKRSVSKLYFPKEPDFYEPFVPKHMRRNPLINRGYWLRMHAVEQTVCHFLEENDKPKMIVNLGCGYDPLPFQFWHRYGSLSEKATFVDVDYPQLIEKKRDRMLTSGLLRDSLFKHNIRQAELPIYLWSDRYLALGCDLRDLDTLERILKNAMEGDTSLLFVAEVSMTYMPLKDASALIKWAGSLNDARFCLLEQFLPQGPKHPFAQTMLEHFNKLQTPIHAVGQHPSLAQQASRFSSVGWPTVISRNLWDLWSDESFTPAHLRRRLDSIEPFDEWEEFALFAGHYFLIVASTTSAKSSAGTIQAEDVLRAQTNLGASNILDLAIAHAASPLTPRRFGAASAYNHDAIALHGGQGLQRRLSSLDILHQEHGKPALQALTSPTARMCHTVTPLNGTDALMVGGRRSPSEALADCWLIRGGELQQVHDMAPARFRHSSTRVIIESNSSEVEGVLVFGGKSSDGVVLDECTIWTPNQGWQKIPVIGKRPSARFGAAICSVGSNWGLIVGGMDSDGTVLGDIWEFRLNALSASMQLQFTERTNDANLSTANSSHARFGASLVPLGETLLLVGGIGRKEITALSDELRIISFEPTINIQPANIVFPDDTSFLFVGFGAAAVGRNKVIVAGGGAVCFSMGSFWNQGYLVITESRRSSPSSWSLSVIEPTHNPQAPARAQASKPSPACRRKGSNKAQTNRKEDTRRKANAVSRVELREGQHFADLVAACKPVIIEGLDLGPCTNLWTLDYLKDKIGSGREVVIHECSSDRMTFKDKNFQYIKKPFGDFIDCIGEGAKVYLRAVSDAQPNKLPTKLEDDFPTIAQDFILPEVVASSVKAGYHSSPLRISGPVSLWLHYDVLANVLCQVRGSKTLHLYPPSDVKHLDFPPGGSSSNTNVLVHQPRNTHPQIAALKPGDVLFIPPMWAHTATPEQSHSVAVNVFWRNLDKGYAAGKDVYGNRDLQAYETGRRDVEKIVKAFRDIPPQMKRFYLDRLAAELQDKADSVVQAVADTEKEGEGKGGGMSVPSGDERRQPIN